MNLHSNRLNNEETKGTTLHGQNTQNIKRKKINQISKMKKSNNTYTQIDKTSKLKSDIRRYRNSNLVSFFNVWQL